MIPIPDEGPLPAGTRVPPRTMGRKMTCWLPLTTALPDASGFSVSAAVWPTPLTTADALAFMEQVAATVAIAADNGINYDRAQALSAASCRDERDQLRFLLDVNNLLVTSSRVSARLLEGNLRKPSGA